MRVVGCIGVLIATIGCAESDPFVVACLENLEMRLNYPASFEIVRADESFSERPEFEEYLKFWLKGLAETEELRELAKGVYDKNKSIEIKTLIIRYRDRQGGETKLSVCEAEVTGGVYDPMRNGDVVIDGLTDAEHIQRNLEGIVREHINAE